MLRRERCFQCRIGGVLFPPLSFGTEHKKEKHQDMAKQEAFTMVFPHLHRVVENLIFKHRKKHC
jgi:hypothetical protein